MSKWRSVKNPSRVKTHKHASEGFYAFDEEGQVIHRLVVSKPPSMGWVWYNSILFKIMYDTVVSDAERGPFSIDISLAFRETLESCIEIRDEDVVRPQPICEEGRLVRSPMVENQVMEYVVPLQPSWTIQSTWANPVEDVSMSAEIIQS